jgi:hypothetical protein
LRSYLDHLWFGPVSRAVDLRFDSTIGGYITEFAIYILESYSQEERYFFKGTRGKFLHFLKLNIKMLLHENNILKIQKIIFKNSNSDSDTEAGLTRSGISFIEVPVVNPFK